MRNFDKCLINDNIWLRNKLGQTLNNFGYFIIHPLINQVCSNNNIINRISTTVVEKIETDNISFSNNNSDMNIKYKNIIISEQFIYDFNSLTSRYFSLKNPIEIKELFSKIEFKFINQLNTFFNIFDSNGRQNNNICSYAALYFFDKLKNIIFVNMNIIDSLMTVEIAISIGLCNVVEIDSSLASSIALLMFPETRIKNTLDLFRVSMDEV